MAGINIGWVFIYQKKNMRWGIYLIITPFLILIVKLGNTVMDMKTAMLLFSLKTT